MHKVMFSDLENPGSLRKDLSKVYNWLMAQRVVKGKIEEIPQKFIDGSLLCELLSKLSGRNCTIGFIHNPKTLSACRSNIRKGLDFLTGFPKFKSNFLWSHEEIIHGDPVAVWGLLSDIMKFYPNYSNNQQFSDVKRAKSVVAVPVREETFQVDINAVKKWLDKIGLRYMIDFSNTQSLKDPLRNGTLFCKVLNRVKGPFEYFLSPKNSEEVWENINIAVWKVKNKFEVKKIQELIEEKPAWLFLYKIMQNFIIKEQAELPYSVDEIRQLKSSIFKWVFSLKPFDSHLPENFAGLVSALRTGVVLSKIVQKLCKSPLQVLKFPNGKEECLQNIEKVLEALRKIPGMSQGYTWDSMEIYKGNQTYTISLLEDLHRFFNKLPPRPTGEKYHQDGPFLGIFTDDSLNISRIDAKSPYNSKSCFMSPSRNNSFSKSFLHTRNPSPISPFLNSPFQHPVEASFDNISPKVKRIKKANFLGFEWLKKIKINLPKNLDLTGEKISEFRSGELLGRILEKIEAKDIHGLQKTRKKTGAAVKNVSLVFELLRKKPIFSTQLYYIERHILDGNGHYIRLLLKEIYRVYKNSIITLVKFSIGKV